MKETNLEQPLSHPEEASGTQLALVTNTWSRSVIQPGLITIMVTALFTGVLVVLKVLLPDSRWLYLIPLFAFTTLEGVYTTLWLARPGQRTISRLAYRTAEFIFIALVVRLFTWTVAGNWPRVELLQFYMRQPFLLFGDLFFLFTLLLIWMAWQQALSVESVFERLAIDSAEAGYYTLPPEEQRPENRPMSTDRSRLVSIFVRQWVWGGAILAVCTALSTLELSEVTASSSLFAIGRLDLRSEILVALLVYFFSGFLLLSQARLAAMSARWLIGGVTKSQQVERDWYRYSLWVLLLVALIATFLPLGSTVAIGRILSLLVLGTFYAISWVAYLFFVLFLGLLSLFGTNGASEEPLPPPNVEEIFPSQPASPTTDLFGMVLSSLFWAVVIVMTVVAISFFLRDRGIRIDMAPVRAWWHRFIDWLRDLRRGVSAQVGQVRRRVQTRLQRPNGEDKTPKRPWRFIRLNALPPREQILYFFLSIVRRAGDQGVQRGQSETPLEYARNLKENWPEAEEDVDTLTEAFLKARYSPRPIEKAEVGPLKRRWRQLRSRLHRRAMKRPEAKIEQNSRPET